MNQKINFKALLISLVISLGTGGLAAFLTRNGMAVYETLNKPVLSPPAWVFPVVWTILYILMGISAYLIYQTEHNKEEKEQALSLYGFQLFFNFLWAIVFFGFQNQILAFVVLVILWLLIIMMIKSFNAINPLAAKLQIPYLLWVTFAGYLNLAIYLIN